MNRTRIVACVLLSLVSLGSAARAQDLEQIWTVQAPLSLPRMDGAVGIDFRDQTLFVVGVSTQLVPQYFVAPHEAGKRILISTYDMGGDINQSNHVFYPNRKVEVDQEFIPVAIAVARRGANPGPPPEADAPVVFVTGSMPGANGSRDCITLAYNGDLSILVWANTFNYQPPGVRAFAGDDVPVSLALDDENDPTRIAVAVTSTGYPSGSHVHLLVYNSQNGQPIGNIGELFQASGGNDTAVRAQFYAHTKLILGANWRPSGSNPSVKAWKYEELVDGNNLPYYAATEDRTYEPNPAACMSAQVNAMAVASVTDHPETIPTYFCGKFIGRPPADQDALLVKFDFGTNPSPTWAATYTSTGEDEGLAIDANGGKYSSENIPIFIPVTGWATDPGGVRRARTILFHDTIGATTAPDLWWVSTDSTGSDDRGLAVELVRPDVGDPDENLASRWRIYTTERSWNGVNFDWRTTQYFSGIQAQPPNPLRAPHSQIFFIGGANGDDVPSALIHVQPVPDPNRYVFVTGKFWNGTNDYDFQTIKYQDHAP